MKYDNITQLVLSSKMMLNNTCGHMSSFSKLHSIYKLIHDLSEPISDNKYNFEYLQTHLRCTPIYQAKFCECCIEEELMKLECVTQPYETYLDQSTFPSESYPEMKWCNCRNTLIINHGLTRTLIGSIDDTTLYQKFYK